MGTWGRTGDDQERWIEAAVGNYYGTPFVVAHGSKFFMGLENWDTNRFVEVSKAFYDAWVLEFDGKNPPVIEGDQPHD